MRAHRFISYSVLGPVMRPVNVSLDSTTWELAKAKANFSGWVRRKLLEEAQAANVRYEYQCEVCYAKFFRGRDRVLGILKGVGCECGNIAMKTGVTE